MKAGKELDALIAEKVMGWRMELWSSYSELLPANKVWVGDDDNYRYVENFKPSTNISDAWHVVEWLEKNIGGISLESHCDERRYSFRVFNGTHWIVARAETAPLAICLAALKCVEGGNADV